MREAIDEFTRACRERGLEIVEPVGDGEWHKVEVAGKAGGKAGRYKLHLDGLPAGAICNHTDGRGTERWKFGGAVTMTIEQEMQHRAEMERKVGEREAERLRKQEAVAVAADERWNATPMASDSHAYLVRKQVRAWGLHADGDGLLVPMRNEHRAVRSLQTISPEGVKRFASGGQTVGLCYSIKGDGTRPDVVAICEGFATAASVREATGLTTLACFTCGNLLPVAEAVRRRLPDAVLLLCADDDAATRGNPGMSKARAAAEAVRGIVVAPEFGAARPEGATDFNDLHCAKGLAEVRRQVWRALETPVETDIVPPPLDDARAMTEATTEGMPEGYSERSGGLFVARRSDDGIEFDRICYPAIHVVARSEDIETRERFVLLRWNDTCAEMPQARALQARYLPELSAQGAVVTSNNARAVVEYLDKALEHQARAGIPLEYLCRSTGWYQDQTCFVRGYDAAHVEPSRPAELRAPRIGGDVEGAQIALLQAIRRRGTMEAWRAAIEPIVLANPRVALALAASAASPLLRIFDGVAEPFCLDLCAESSVGKTSTLAMCASMWGSTGLFQKWNDTLTAQERLAGCLRGLPLLRDESQLADPLQVGKSVYDITTKVGKSRGTIAGMQERVTFESILISTGETPVASMVEAGGHVARCVTIWGHVFEQQGKEQAALIHATLSATADNHGHAGAELVDLLVRMGHAGHATLRREYLASADHFATQLAQLAPGNQTSARIAKHVALLEIAWRLLCRATGLQWNSPTLIGKRDLAAILERSSNSDKLVAARDSIIGWINANPDRVQRDDTRAMSSQSIIARVVRKAGARPVAYLIPDTLHAQIKALGHHVEATIAGWLERGYLVKPESADGSKGRTHSTRIGGGVVKAYRFAEELSQLCADEPESAAGGILLPSRFDDEPPF